MTTEARTETQGENELALLTNGEQELAALHARIEPHFRRAEVRERVGRFLRGLLSRVERKNGWQLAEELDESGPQGVQRLLHAATWNEALTPERWAQLCPLLPQHAPTGRPAVEHRLIVEGILWI